MFTWCMYLLEYNDTFGNHMRTPIIFTSLSV